MARLRTLLKNERDAARSNQLFDHLLASRPRHERRALPWILAALINAAIVEILLVSNSSLAARHDAQRAIPAIVPVNDEPVLLIAPRTSAPVTNVEGAAAPSISREILPTNNRARLNTTVATPSTAGAPSRRAPQSLPERMGATPEPRFRGTPLSVPSPPSAAEALRTRINLELTSINDSIGAETAARKKSSDWTIGNKGNRWGISPGRFHLGKVTPPVASASNDGPIPDLILPPPGRREDGIARVRSWQEVEAGAARAEHQSVFDQRVKSIRSRVDDARRVGATRKSKWRTTLK